MTDAEERIYLDAQRAVWHQLLNQCLRELGAGDAEAGKARWASERTEVVLLLRRLCAEQGDNGWPDDLHLADVIEKHLWRPLPDES